MTAETQLEKLQTYEAALQEIAKKIENQEAYDTYLSSNGGSWRAKEELRAATYRKIVRIMNAALKRHSANPEVCCFRPSLAKH